MSSASTADEIKDTVDAGVELANALAGDGADSRRILVDHGFVRAAGASDAEIQEVGRRFGPVAVLLGELPGAPLSTAVGRINAELTASPLAPSVVAHDGAPLHIHWTAPEAMFSVQVVVDVLMAVAQTLCGDGTLRFGRCAAPGCERLYFDATKNRSRRFCSDPRCASRTHTAEHRARLRT